MLALHAPSLQGASGLSLRWMQVRRGASTCPPQKSGTMSTICKSGTLARVDEEERSKLNLGRQGETHKVQRLSKRGGNY